MKKLLALIISLLMPIALFACKKEEQEPPALTDENGQAPAGSPFADANTDEDRYYLTQRWSNYVVYEDNYYTTCSGVFVAVPLYEAAKHNAIEEGEMRYVDAVTPLCFDAMCEHKDRSCPAMPASLNSDFVIDAAESNGDQPVIYFYRDTGYDTGTEELTVLGAEIMRFDVAQGKSEQVAFSKTPIKQLMTYGDSVYYTTQESDGSFIFHAVKKTGGEVKQIAPGVGPLALLGANKQGAYFNDSDGKIYRADLSGEACEVIYTLSEVYVMGPPVRGAAELDMFVNGDYLYFNADYAVREIPSESASDGADEFLAYNVRRVRLDAPSGEGELVAEGVFERSTYGIYNGVLYYGPFDAETDLETNDGSDFSTSKGTVKGVDLETLESFTVISDCGLNIWNDCYYVNDRCIIGSMTPYRDMDCHSDKKPWGTMLLDFQTGALYGVEPNPSLQWRQN